MLLSEATRFCVVGPGRLGSALRAALDAAGLTVSAIVANPDGVAPTPPDSLVVPLATAAAAADVFWLTVPDDRIAGVARDLADALPAAPVGAVPRAIVALHSSGLGPLSLLEPLAVAGAATLALHPLQSFAGGDGGGDALTGVPAAVTATSDAARAFGHDLATRLGCLPFDLADEDKPLYHLSAAVASNLLVALESEAAALLAAASGRGREESAALLAPLVATTAANVGARGPAAAVTGPVARGDVGTVRAHLALLERHAPRFAATYRALSLEALNLAAPRLDDEAVRTLRALLAPTGESPRGPL